MDTAEDRGREQHRDVHHNISTFLGCGSIFISMGGFISYLYIYGWRFALFHPNSILEEG